MSQVLVEIAALKAGLAAVAGQIGPNTTAAMYQAMINARSEAMESSVEARLIAAAPDLLAALQDCYALLENDAPLDFPCGPEMRKARAAIAKATGSAA